MKLRTNYFGREKENNFGKYVVIEHTKIGYVTVRFEKSSTIAEFPISTFNKNQCYDFMQPTVYGVGYLGEIIKNDKCEIKHQANSIWRGVLRRCYFEDTWENRPNYEGCSVSDEWKSLKSFKSFLKGQIDLGFYKKGYQLDKDLLVHGNKLYSAETCVFLPFILNSLQQVDKRSKGGYLPGVHYATERGKYKTEVYFDGKKYFLGRFESEIEAFEVYKKAKEDLVRENIYKWEDLIDPRATQAFSNYSLEWVYNTDRYKSLSR